MKPLPKYLSVLAIAAAVLGALNSAEVLAILGPKAGAILTLVSTLVAALSHSLTGDGGKS